MENVGEKVKVEAEWLPLGFKEPSGTQIYERISKKWLYLYYSYTTCGVMSGVGSDHDTVGARISTVICFDFVVKIFVNMSVYEPCCYLY